MPLKASRVIVATIVFTCISCGFAEADEFASMPALHEKNEAGLIIRDDDMKKDIESSVPDALRWYEQSLQFSSASDVCNFLRASQGSIIGFDGNASFLNELEWCKQKKKCIDCANENTDELKTHVSPEVEENN